jgi:hypothetical protein
MIIEERILDLKKVSKNLFFRADDIGNDVI